jgi:hypothetical protein
MGFRFRKRIKLLPGVFINLSKSGASTTVKLGGVSWNSRTKRTSVNLPGPFSYHASSRELKKAELVELAKRHNLKGYSKLNKQELIEFLHQNGI